MLLSLTKRRWHVLCLSLLTLVLMVTGLSSLPVIDRDEARFAQASVQMAETNDLMNIKFQDEARNKKPAAAYWAQTAMIKTFARDGENRIWAQRLPSVLAALLTILALYWGSLRMVGRKAGFIACALLATSLIFVFEAHIAKTDALLCASTTLIFTSLGRLRNGPGKIEVWVFWIALGLSIMIKGPIGPVLAILTLLCLGIWERNLSWARPLLNWGAILAFTLIWLPWACAMFVITDGAFFIESLGQDFGGKVISGQENHGAPPGSHSAVIWPTKLPHYGLPVFPALCLMIGVSVVAMDQMTGFLKSRIAGGLIFILMTTVLLGGLVVAQNLYANSGPSLTGYLICGGSWIFALSASICLWIGKIRHSFYSALLSSIIAMIGAYGLVYHIGKDMNLKAENISLSDGKLVILNTRREETVPLSKVLAKSAKSRNRCIAASNPVKGFNYSKGAPLTLVILKEVPCGGPDQKGRT